MNVSSNPMSANEDWIQLPLTEGLTLLGKRVSAVSGSLPRQNNAWATPGIPISKDENVIEFLGIPYSAGGPVKRWEKGTTHNLSGLLDGNAMGRSINTGSITPRYGGDFCCFIACFIVFILNLTYPHTLVQYHT